ncbi:MAG: hypothetical protein P1P76_09835 [Anaerolineales bacterium]|nr:hypothetical protein [Anaerolineales bacterium]
MRRWSILCGAAMIVLLAASGCGVLDRLRRNGEGGVSETPMVVETGRPPREITGQEALELYGVVTEVVGPTRTPESWFPIKALVLPNVLPYDPEETIEILSVFTREELSEGGTWMGDLRAGSEVVLHSVSPDGAKCLVEGTAVQGWPVKGWVACNRLETGAD